LRLSALAASPWFACGCGGEPITHEFEQPIRAQGADFVKGALPGTRPLTGEEQGQGVLPTTPTVLEVSIPPAVRVGSATFQIPGVVSSDAAAVGFRFADIGSGYWVRPGTTQAQNGGYTFSVDATISSDAPVGEHSLLFAGIGPDGRSGTQQSYNLCLEPQIPDKLSSADPALPGNACDPKQEPPALVVSLAWDAPVDLDLKVVTPSGKIVDPKHPNTADPVDGKVDPTAPGVGVLDGDSNADCKLDNRNRENLVFETPPASGRYAVYADLYNACGKGSVRFELSLVTGQASTEPDTFEQVTTFRQGGVLIASQADGGSKLGLFVTEFVAE
jgi:hypothetical protein